MCERNLKSYLKIFLHSLAAASLLSACSSSIKKADIDPNASPVTEIQNLDRAINEARAQQVDVLAPKNFVKASESLDKAKSQQDKGKEGKDILDSVAYGQAYLKKAQDVASEANPKMAEILKARTAAIAAGAPQFAASEFGDIDHDLKKQTDDFEKGDFDVPTAQLANLQARYLDAELQAIKVSKLSEPRNILKNAKDQGAQKLVPQTYQKAETDLIAAERAIETDRHNQAAIDAASQKAIMSAQELHQVFGLAKNAKADSPESVAVALQEKNRALATANQQLHETTALVQGTSAQLQSVQVENAKLAAEKRLQDTLEKARQQFSSQEADVYRQGDALIIRLKSLQFAKNQSDLRAPSLATLAKVKEVMQTLNPEKVRIEGHTDSIGSASLNKKLSEKRADAIKEYFTAENAVKSDHIETVGYGFEKPISSNKTKQGRAQNRRVDIVINPSTTL